MLVQGSGYMAVMTAVTGLLLHQCALDTGTECFVVSTGNK